MIGKKLITILQTLDQATFRRLGDAFASPYFTSSPLLLKLYALLKKEYPVFDTAKLDKEKVYKALYPDKPYNDGALRVLVREFSKITEDFLVFESLKNDESARQKMLTKWYGEHNLYAEFEKSTHALLAKMENQPYRDVEYFDEAASLYASYFFHQNTEKYTLDDQVLTQLMESVDSRLYPAQNAPGQRDEKPRAHPVETIRCAYAQRSAGHWSGRAVARQCAVLHVPSAP